MSRVLYSVPRYGESLLYRILNMHTLLCFYSKFYTFTLVYVKYYKYPSTYDCLYYPVFLKGAYVLRMRGRQA